MESEFISLEEFASDSEDRPGTWGEREPVLLLTPPWVGRDDYAHRDFTVSLHNEILDFWDWAGPNPTRHAQRQRVLSRITHILQDVFPEGRLHVFGSFGLGVYLESGDVDLVLELPENSQAHPLSRIKSEFLRKDFVSFIEVIDGASVPIVKFDAKEEQISGDICVNNMSGVHALEFFREKLAQFPCMKFLLLVLKQFVKSRNLNETFHGGIGSFLLQNMLLAFLQGFYKRARFENETPDQFFNRTNLGILLIAFFQYFSLEHNYVTVGIDTRGAGVLKPKSLFGSWDKERPWQLCLVNPLDENLDIGRNSYFIMRVRDAFEHAYRELVYEDTRVGAPTLLSRIIPPKNLALTKNFK